MQVTFTHEFMVVLVKLVIITAFCLSMTGSIVYFTKTFLDGEYRFWNLIKAILWFAFVMDSIIWMRLVG